VLSCSLARSLRPGELTGTYSFLSCMHPGYIGVYRFLPYIPTIVFPTCYHHPYGNHTKHTHSHTRCNSRMLGRASIHSYQPGTLPVHLYWGHPHGPAGRIVIEQCDGNLENAIYQTVKINGGSLIHPGQALILPTG
jgi:hypothetical protein